jgi:competence protein ComEA
MKPHTVPVNSWLGHSRRERRASVILLAIIAGLILMRYSFKGKEIMVEDVSELYTDSLTACTADTETPLSVMPQELVFDPNTVTEDTLKIIGFSDRQAHTLVRYRERGGRFKFPGDIKKVYGLDSHLVRVSEPRIVIRDSRELRSDSVRRKSIPSVIELNTCDSATLTLLPGIGPVLSGRIIKYRKILGGFVSTSQLKEVYGLQEDTFLKIIDHLSVDTSFVRKIRINEADVSGLRHLPYISRYEISAILKYRQLRGSISDIRELVENKIITAVTAGRIEYYIDFRPSVH